MTFKTIEDIEAWQMARALCKLVKKLTDKELFSKDWELRKQIRNSSGSTMDCIAEGHERGNNNEFRFFLGVAKGSCGEVRSQAYRALDYGYISAQEQNELDQLARKTSAVIQGLINYLNKTAIKGQRYSASNTTQNTDPNFPNTPPPTQ